MLVQVLSFLQVQWTSLCNAVNNCRRKYVVPTALQGGRDMVLLHIGGWVDDSPSIPEHVIDCRYVAAEHRIRSPGDDMPYFHRPPYLTVEDAEHDMTDFFAGLKLSHDYMLTDAEFMVLYAHQTQRFPVGPIQILTKDFDEKTLNIWFEEEEAEEEEDQTGLIQSIRLVDGEGDETKTSIPRNESDESITSTSSEPICGSNFNFIK